MVSVPLIMYFLPLFNTICGFIVLSRRVVIYIFPLFLSYISPLLSCRDLVGGDRDVDDENTRVDGVGPGGLVIRWVKAPYFQPNARRFRERSVMYR